MQKTFSLFISGVSITLFALLALFATVQPVSAETADDILSPATKNRYGFLTTRNKKSKYRFIKNTSARWVRPHPGPFVWGKVQTTKNGDFDFTQTDKWVKRAQKQNLSMLATIFPYAAWDQQARSNTEECINNDGFADQMTKYRCNPKHWKKYRQWVRAVVERYDGDGVDDMPGLTRAIKHWEVNNEPDLQPTSDISATKEKGEGEESQEDDIRFYVGTAKNYRRLLRETNQAIKAADEDAKTVVAAAASSLSFSEDFFDTVFSGKNVKNHFDIANMHCISNSCAIGNFNVRWYKNLLKANGLGKKPIWVTEAQAYISEDKDINAAQYKRSLRKARQLGAKRIFITHMTFKKPEYESYGSVTNQPTVNENLDGSKPKATFKKIFRSVR